MSGSPKIDSGENQAASGVEATAVQSPVDVSPGSGVGRGNRTPAAVAATEVGEPSMETSMADLLGSSLGGRFIIHRKIGQGGMGAVFEATQTTIGKKVAIKILLDKYARREAIVARLEQEARLASSIGHEHIIDITDFGQTPDGRTYVVMELLDGESLAECMHRENKMPEQRVLRIAQQAASALAAAHAKGIVHRDIKPENLFLLQRGNGDFIKVVDFGISKSMRASEPDAEDSPRLTHTGMVLGTPLYMSPEQARGDDNLDHRIDVYALGVVMYEAATGRVPFIGTNYLSVISQVLADDPPTPRELVPSLSEEFEAIVLRALAKEREDRYPSADAMRADITTLLDDPSRSTERARIQAPKRPDQRKRGLRLLLWATGIAILLAALVTTMVMMLSSGPKAQALAVAPVIIDARAPADAALPAPPVIVEISIASNPSGAVIYEGGRVVGTTPTIYRAALSNERVELVAKLNGYLESAFFVNPLVDKDRAVTDPVMVTLTEPEPTPATKPGNGKTRGSHKTKDPIPASGTKPPPGEPAGGGELHGNPWTKSAGGSGAK